MFPMLSEVRVDTLLRENDNNVEMIVDIILNEMYLETEQQEKNFSYLHPQIISVRDPNYNEDNSLVSESRFKHRKKKRRKQKQNKVIFQNNGHRPNSNKSSLNLGLQSPSSSSSSSSTSSYFSLKQSKNPWNNLEHESQDGMIDDSKLCQLISMFPDHDFERLKQVLVNCNGEVQKASDILSSKDLKDGKGQQGQGIIQIPYTNEYQATHLLNKEKNDTIRSYKIYDNEDNDDYEDSYDPEYCHQEIYKCYKKRDESFKNADQSFRKGGKGARSVASYQSNEVRSLVHKLEILMSILLRITFFSFNRDGNLMQK